MKLLCPRCGHDTVVRQTWGATRTQNVVTRRRRCVSCNYRFSTVEMIVAPSPPITAEALRERNRLKQQRKRKRARDAAAAPDQAETGGGGGRRLVQAVDWPFQSGGDA